MATEVKKTVRILTKNEQKQSIKGVQKTKKNITKNYLDSPFTLEWPKLSPEDEEQVTALLKKSCSGLKKLDCKPPWKQVAKYKKGAERKEFLKEYYKKFQETLDPESIKKNKEIEEALSHLIFGYNAVMRAMERDNVAAILVKKNVKPDFVTKAFLPGCATKCIPLVPLNDLEEVLRDKETLALPHTCMVLGLKLSVKDESNLFYPLLTKMCEVLGVQKTDDDSSEDEEHDEEESIECPAPDKVEKQGNRPLTQLSEVNVSSYHLKRNGNKGRRVFVPDAQEQQVEEMNIGDSFLSFGPTQTQQEKHKIETNITEPEKPSEDKSENVKSLPALENTDFGGMIVLDTTGGENPSTLSLVNDEPSVSQEPAKNNAKRKQKRKHLDSNSYIPAKTKQLKGNPDRKGRVK